MTYWEHKGEHQDLYMLLVEKLVPVEGRCATTHGELLRAISRIYYDIYNNGGANMDLRHMGYFIGVLVDWSEELKKRIGSEEDWNYLMHRLHNWVGEYVDDDQLLGILERVIDACVLEVHSIALPNIEVKIEGMVTNPPE